MASNPPPPPARHSDVLGELLSTAPGDEDAVRRLDQWCDVALDALQAKDAATGVEPAPLAPIVRHQLYALRSSAHVEQRLLLVLLVLNCNANLRSYLGERSDPLLYPAFLRHLDEACQHFLMGTRADHQPVLRMQDAEYSSFSVLVHRLRLAYLTYHMQPAVEHRRDEGVL